MSVIEYQRKFTRLSKYAPEILVSEEEKCRRFEDGLNDLIRTHVTGFFHDDFSKIVTCALNVERVKKEEKERKDKRQGKKNPGQSSSQQQQRKRFRGPQGSSQPTAQATGRNTTLLASSVASAPGGASRGQTAPHCSHCEKNHKGECWKLTGACLICGSKSIEREIVQELVHLQHPRLGVQLQWHRKATRVLHHRVFQDKGHRPWVGKMVVLQLEHMQ